MVRILVEFQPHIEPEIVIGFVDTWFLGMCELTKHRRGQRVLLLLLTEEEYRGLMSTLAELEEKLMLAFTEEAANAA